MLGRILCLLGLHRKVLAKACGPAAGDIYACRCARPTCKWSASAADLRPERRPGVAAGGAIAGGKVRF